MGQSIGPAQISDDGLVVRFFLISFLISGGSFLRLVDFDEGISIYLIILKRGIALNNFKVASSISFSAFQVPQVYIGEHLSAFDKISRIGLDGLQNTHSFFNIV